MSDAPALRVAVVGGSSGLGRCIGIGLAEKGAQVAFVARRQDRLENAAKEAGNEAAAVVCDVTDAESCQRAVSEVADAFGGLEVLVNNAGISVKKRQDMLDVPPESFDALIDTNLRGPYFLTQAIARRWLANPPPRHRRSIINIASVNSKIVSIERAEFPSPPPFKCGASRT